VVDPYTLDTSELIEFEKGETVVSHFISHTLGKPGESHLIIGSGLEVKLSPRSCQLGFIKVYKFTEGGSRLEFIHSTPCEELPGAFAEHKGRLIAGVGRILRVYELGQKKLLRKCENKTFRSAITTVRVEEGRVFAGDT